MYAATALPGQVVQFTADGKVTPVWADDAVQAFSLAACPDGSLLVGTGPQGIVYRISAKGEAKEFYKTGSLYVWDLVLRCPEQCLRGHRTEGGDSQDQLPRRRPSVL